MFNNTKKTAFILILALMLVVFSACGKPSAPAGTSSPSGSAAPAQSTDPASADAIMGDFDAKTLDGDSFKSSDLAASKLTMVNVWTTTCGFCIKEMPDLQELYKNLPEGTNMITICFDGAKNGGSAKKVLENAGAEFKTLIPDQKLIESLGNVINAVPTTIFVDSEGKQVGDLIIGVPSLNDTANAYLAQLNARLETLK